MKLKSFRNLHLRSNLPAGCQAQHAYDMTVSYDVIVHCAKTHNAKLAPVLVDACTANKLNTAYNTCIIRSCQVYTRVRKSNCKGIYCYRHVTQQVNPLAEKAQAWTGDKASPKVLSSHDLMPAIQNPAPLATPPPLPKPPPPPPPYKKQYCYSCLQN